MLAVPSHLVHVSLKRRFTGTALVPWNLNDDYLYNMWLVISVPNEADTNRIRNIVSGTDMDLTGSKSL